ncbi:MAG: energy-coupling factor ABC transporter ATP-binding protein [Deltaproteobacteria bacterium]|jgi:biotin transport system ATP-binding protein|nr:energy-coupling factor ABC transporter ATP-binding protein [Deltaproteobacteria bacterium]
MEGLGVRLIVEKVSFAHPGQETLISDLSFELKGGEILGLAGQNGAGKSTLLDLLAGIIAPTAGKISLLDHKVDQEAEPSWAQNSEPKPDQNFFKKSQKKAKNKNHQERRKRISLLPQNVDFFILGDTPREDLSLALAQRAALVEGQEILKIAERWGLGDWLDRPVENLSLGQKKRLALASSLAADPEVLLLDEPFSGLDWPGSLNFLEDLKTLPEKKLIVVLATHEPNLVKDLVNIWLLMKPGKFLLAKPEESFKHLAEFGVRPVGF